MTTTSETDVLIVGAGPTGLALALELAAQQVPFRIIDRAQRRSPYSRAIVVQPRTLEVLRRHGDVGELAARGNVAAGSTVCVAGRRVADLDLDLARIRAGTAFPLPLAVSQRDTEAWLEARLAARGRAVEMGVEARGIAQDGRGATVRIGPAPPGDGDEEDVGAAREEVVRAKYVVGADGAHSCVRHAAANMTFEGEAYQQEFILADTHIDTQAKTDRAYMCFGRGVMVLLPLRDGLVRLVVSRPANADADASAAAAKDLPPARLEDFQEFLDQVFPGGGALRDPVWLTRFRLHHRGVNRYRDGRLLVAGDAAHIHSPAGGQGMNTGIQDAANLGWKLGAVLRADEDDEKKKKKSALLLDSYHAERHPVGQHLLRHSDASFTYVASTNPVFVYLRNLVLPWVLPWLLASRSLVARQFEFISQLRVRYRHSSGGGAAAAIVGTAPGFSGPIRGGDRAADGKIRIGDAGGEGGEKWLQELFSPESHHLVLFSGGGGVRNAAGEGDLHRAEARFLERVDAGARVKVHAVLSEGREGSGHVDVGGELHRMYGFEDGAGYVLVRPDGYVAHIGPLSALDGASDWL